MKAHCVPTKRHLLLRELRLRLLLLQLWSKKRVACGPAASAAAAAAAVTDEQVSQSAWCCCWMYCCWLRHVFRTLCHDFLGDNFQSQNFRQVGINRQLAVASRMIRMNNCLKMPALAVHFCKCGTALSATKSTKRTCHVSILCATAKAGWSHLRTTILRQWETKWSHLRTKCGCQGDPHPSA